MPPLLGSVARVGRKLSTAVRSPHFHAVTEGARLKAAVRRANAAYCKQLETGRDG